MESSTVGSQKILELEARLEKATDQRTRIDLLHEIAWTIHLEDQVRARALAEQAYGLSASDEFEEKPYLPGLAGSLRSLVALNTDAGNYDLALSQSLRALEILEEIPDEKIENSLTKMDVLGVASWTYRCLGDYAVSAEYAMKGLKLAQAIGERRYETGMLNILSVIYAETDDLTAALETGQKVVQICREEGNVRGESIALNNLAMTYLELGNGEQALETCKESLRLARENGIEAVALTALSTMGEIYLGIKDFVRAEEYLCRALTSAREKKAGSDELQCLLGLGKVYQYQQNDQAALSILQSALSLSRSSNDRRGEFQCHQLLSEIYERQGNLVRALQHYKQYHLVKEQVFNETADDKLRNLRISHEVEALKKESEIHRLKNVELQAALEQVKQLSGLLPICASCNKIRDDTGYWQDVAVYIRDHSEAKFSHGICPECMERLYPEIVKKHRNENIK